MSPALLDRQRPLGDMLEAESVRLAAGTSRARQAEERGGLTLDDLITGVWEGLTVGNSVHCPACGGTMVSRSAARADALEGDCRDCGARIY